MRNLLYKNYEELLKRSLSINIIKFFSIFTRHKSKPEVNRVQVDINYVESHVCAVNFYDKAIDKTENQEESINR